MSSYLGNKLISGAEQFVGESRNIGQIIPSTIPLTDAGLHLLDGALINGSGIYSAFVDAIADLVTDYPDLFETEANWQSAVTTYGVCGKFVYDSVNNTVRLPKITGIVEGTTDITALGNLVEAGLPNITGDFWVGRSENNASGAFVKITTTGSYSNASNANDGGHYSFDASRSSSIYGNSLTVQPQTIKVLYYIVIATSTKTDIEVDIDEVVTDLNGKADVDFNNVTDTANILMAHNAMPSSTYVSLTLGASGTSYTAPTDGYYRLSCMPTVATTNYIAITTPTLYITMANAQIGYSLDRFAPVKKGDVITIAYLNIQSVDFRFVYAKGSESEV